MRAARLALLSLALAGCRIERAESGRPAGTRTAVDSLMRIEQDSADGEAVRLALRGYYRDPVRPGSSPVPFEPVEITVRSYGDVAQAWAVVRTRRTSAADTLAERRGIDAFQLAKQGGRWRIVNIASSAELPSRPLPPRR